MSRDVQPEPRRRPTSGGYAKGDATREQLIEAAIALFAEYGVDGTSTRSIAERAQVSLPALTYYFGGKAGLYQACAEYVVTHLQRSLVDAATLEPDTPLGIEPVRRAFLAGLDAFAALMLGDTVPEQWVWFILREQQRPGPAFDLIYQQVLGPFVDRMVDLAGTLQPERALLDIRLDLIGLLGQVLFYRSERAAALALTGWNAVGAAEAALVRRRVRVHAEALFGAAAKLPSEG